MGLDVAFVVQREVDSRNQGSVDEYFYLFGLVSGAVGPEAGQEGGRMVGAVLVLYDDGVAHSAADGCLLETAA